MAEKLPDGLYPFIDRSIPLSELTMVEAPRELEELLKSQAVANGVELLRDTPVELTCKTPDGANPTFLIFWPTEDAHIHLLVPKQFVEGRG